MYTPPHEFALNPPAVLSAVRRQTYDAYLPRLPGRRAAVARCSPRRWRDLVLAVLGAAHGGGAGARPAGSPYRVIAYPALLVAVGLPAVWSIVVMAGRPARTGGSLTGAGLASPAPWRRRCGQAATLRNLRGGGADCSYPGDEPSGARRRLHHLVAWGFVACAGSTVAAAVSQDIAGNPPPYPVLSAPVLLGIVGGAALVVGCAGLLLLRPPGSHDAGRRDGARGCGAHQARLRAARRAAHARGDRSAHARAAGHGGVRAGAGVHLAAVVACFAIAPYTKFMHVIYRFLALVQDNAEATRRPPTGRP